MVEKTNSTHTQAVTFGDTRVAAVSFVTDPPVHTNTTSGNTILLRLQPVLNHNISNTV